MNPALREFASVISGFKFPRDRCLYCDSCGPCQMDHFPIPRSLGGTDTVRACLHCHNLKDRLSDALLRDQIVTQLPDGISIAFTEAELAFSLGRASLLPLAMRCMIDDIRDFPPLIRIFIARLIREQLARFEGLQDA